MLRQALLIRHATEQNRILKHERLGRSSEIMIGIDASKSHLDAYERPSGCPKRFINNASYLSEVGQVG